MDKQAQTPTEAEATAGTLDLIEHHLRRATDLLNLVAGPNPNRALGRPISLVLTKVEEADMWLARARTALTGK